MGCWHAGVAVWARVCSGTSVTSLWWPATIVDRAEVGFWEGMDLPIRHYLPVRCVMIVSHLRVSWRAQRDDCVTPVSLSACAA
eukprot:9163831-Pyramimonas_sp.AAC.2